MIDTIERFFKIEVGTYERSNIGPSTKRGPLSAHKRNAISIAFCWRANSGPRLSAGWDITCLLEYLTIHKEICAFLDKAVL